MRVTYLELLGQKHPMCFSVTASLELDQAFGGLENMAGRFQEGGLAQRAEAINTALKVLLKAGRVYASAAGLDVPPPLPCEPVDLIDGTDGNAVKNIFSAISGSAEREVEIESKNGGATRDQQAPRGFIIAAHGLG